jgi:hypothetical protein
LDNIEGLLPTGDNLLQQGRPRIQCFALLRQIGVTIVDCGNGSRVTGIARVIQDARDDESLDANPFAGERSSAGASQIMWTCILQSKRLADAKERMSDGVG